jgi:hypothetical protein
LRAAANTHRRKTHGEKNVNKQARALYLAIAIFNSRNPISAFGRGEREREKEKWTVEVFIARGNSLPNSLQTCPPSNE